MKINRAVLCARLVTRRGGARAEETARPPTYFDAKRKAIGDKKARRVKTLSVEA